MAYFDGPGKGRKQCPKCKLFIAARQLVCECEGGVKPVVEKVFKFFDKPGQGRKQCDGCKKYIGARVLQCECGHVCVKKEKLVVVNVDPVEEIIEVSSKPRSALAAGDYNAPLSDPVVRDAAIWRAVYGGSGRTILFPAYSCPVKLNGDSEDEVNTWIDRVMSAGSANGLHYAPSALKYFVRHFYDFGTSEHENVCCHIVNNMSQRIADRQVYEPLAPEIDEADVEELMVA